MCGLSAACHAAEPPVRPIHMRHRLYDFDRRETASRIHNPSIAKGKEIREREHKGKCQTRKTGYFPGLCGESLDSCEIEPHRKFYVRIACSIGTTQRFNVLSTIAVRKIAIKFFPHRRTSIIRVQLNRRASAETRDFNA